MKIMVKFQSTIVMNDIELADTFWLRLSGYMFRKSPHGPGFLFEQNNGIHTFFMNFPLDLVFLDKEYRIVKLIKNIKPWRHTRFYFKARHTLEVPVGKLPDSLKEGDVLEVVRV